MEKLLHERLREVKKGQSWLIVKPYGDHFIMRRQDAERLAAEIERYYIPRPRFEDGEPVKWGELFRGFNGEECDLAAFTVSSDGYYLLNEYSCDCDFSLKSYNDFVKRPTPKVYDADGVAYERGQHVWHTETGEEYIVIDLPTPDCYQSIQVESVESGYKTGYDTNRLTHERPLFDADRERIKTDDTVWNKAGIKLTVKDFEADKVLCKGPAQPNDLSGTYYEYPCNLTHREPDSLLKVRDSLGFHYDGGEYEKIPDDINRLTALIERGA